MSWRSRGEDDRLRTRNIRFAALLTVLLAGAACGPESPDDLSIEARRGDASSPFFRVLGADLTEFRGQIGDETGSRSVDGIIPQDYVLENARGFVTGTFTKTKRGRQSITAQVFVGGELQAQQTTNVDRGTVSVTAPLD